MLEPPELKTEQLKIQLEPDAIKPVKKKVGGWLLFLCISLTILSPIRTLLSLATYPAIARLLDAFPKLKWFCYIDTAFGFVLMFLGIRAGIFLWKVKPNAVKIAKNYLLLLLGYSVIAAILPFTIGLPKRINNELTIGGVQTIIQGLVYFTIWYLYLSKSKRVKETYSDTSSE